MQQSNLSDKSLINRPEAQPSAVVQHILSVVNIQKYQELSIKYTISQHLEAVEDGQAQGHHAVMHAIGHYMHAI